MTKLPISRNLRYSHSREVLSVILDVISLEAVWITVCGKFAGLCASCEARAVAKSFDSHACFGQGRRSESNLSLGCWVVVAVDGLCNSRFLVAGIRRVSTVTWCSLMLVFSDTVGSSF